MFKSNLTADLGLINFQNKRIKRKVKKSAKCVKTWEKIFDRN